MTEGFQCGLVSVVIPTYNRADTILRAMDSVWTQSYRPIELIVVDDGSTDMTRALLEEWKAHHPCDEAFCVQYFRKDKEGAPSARNIGLVRSRGEYVQFLDSDDLLLPKKLETSVDYLVSRSDVDLVYSAWCFVDSSGKTTPAQNIPDLERRLGPSEIVVRKLPTLAAIYRRDLLAKAGPWDERLLCSQDWEYHARVTLAARGAVFIKRCDAVVRLDSTGRIGDLANRNYDPDWIMSRAQACISVFEALKCAQTEDSQPFLLLAQRFEACVRGMLVAGRPRSARCLILGQEVIWKRGGFSARVRAILWLLASLCPPVLYRRALRCFVARR